MEVKITRVDDTLPLPEYQTKGAAGFDIYTRQTTTLQPRQLAKIPSNLIVAAPKGYYLQVSLRSSTPKKFGLLAPHGIGVIDEDYSGPKDEIWIQVYNFTDQPVTIERGQRFAQGLFIKVKRAKWQESGVTKQKSRGGGGSTGH